ncbi:MAG TPA: signal peptidase I [Thermoleophilaceae bacterium]
MALLAAIALPNAIGMRSFTVMSGSMEPTIHVGDVVIDRKISPLSARPGDVVTFSDPTGRKRLITHRIRSLHVHGNTVQVVTKGDANNAVERWSVPANGRIGRVELRVWKLGYPLVYAHSRLGLIGMMAVPALLLCLVELRRIWRSPSREEAHELPA